MTDDGVYNYKYVDGAIQERSAEELQADRNTQSAYQMMTIEELNEVVKALLEGV